MMIKTIIGVFDDRKKVESAINELREEGFNPKDISIVMQDHSQAEEISTNTGVDVAGGAVSGATTGALIGGLAGLVAATVLPGIGAFFIGGPIAASLGLTGAAASTVSGAATGAVAGGLLGALMSFGLTRDEAERYQNRIQQGAILIAVPATDRDEDVVLDIFDEYEASEVKNIAHDNERMEELRSRRQFADEEPVEVIDKDEEPTVQSFDAHHVAGIKGGKVKMAERKRTTRSRRT